MAVLCCLGVLLAAALAGPSPIGIPSVGSSVGNVGQFGDAVPSLDTWFLVLAGLACGVMAASGPATLRPRVGASQHGTRAPPSWSGQVG